MSDQPLMTLADLARIFGTSRQNIQQLMARSDKAPPAAMVLNNGMRLFEEKSVRDWWEHRMEDNWNEVREFRRGGAVQVNMRLSNAEVVRVDALRGPGQTRASLVRHLVLLGLKVAEAAAGDDEALS